MKRRIIGLCLLALGLFTCLNVIAYRHAWRMTHFVDEGERTASPKKLSVLGKVKTLLWGVQIPRPIVGAVGPDFPQPVRTIKFRARDGVELEAWDVPSKLELERGVAIMFHGYAVSRSSTLGETRVLHELGWRTLVVDQRGSGGSDGSATTLGWNEARDVAAAVNWARREWPTAPLLLYGQSMGSVAVLRAIATEEVQPDAIIVECPFDTLLRTIGHRYHSMGLPAFPFAQLLLFWGGRQHKFDAFAHNPVAYANSVRCPALVLDGEHDPWVRPAEVRRVAATMRGPTLCHIFSQGGHGGYWWDAADEYRKTVGEWLKTISKDHASNSKLK